MPISDNSLGLRLADNVEKVILGKRKSLTHIVAAFLAGGHILIEDVPGTGKTMLARALAKSMDLEFRRVQFTPDLLPSDLTGVSVYNQKSGDFEFKQGPLFTNILLADELNRATPRTQSALLEAMEELTVSVDGITHPLPKPYCVIATQNPIEQHGVYHLPEAQLDRFLIRIRLGYADVNEERKILEAQKIRHPSADLSAVIQANELMEEQTKLRDEVEVEANVADYIVRLVGETRNHPEIALGASARASLGLYRLSQAQAWMEGLKFVTPRHVKALAPYVLCHRIMLKPQARIGGVTPESILEEILAKVEVPTMRLREVGEE